MLSLSRCRCGVPLRRVGTWVAVIVSSASAGTVSTAGLSAHNKSATVGLGSLHKGESGDRFWFQAGKVGFRTLAVTDVSPNPATGRPDGAGERNPGFVSFAAFVTF